MTITDEELAELRELLANAVYGGDGKDTRRVLDRVPRLVAEVERLREAMLDILNASPDLEYRESVSIDHYAEVLCDVKNIAAKALGEEAARAALPEKG